MLTVKHITMSEEEFVYWTSHVNFVPATAKNRNVASNVPLPPSEDSVWIYDASGRSTELTGGTVFVMNEFGKTVSRYDLGASSVGFEISPVHSAYALKRDAEQPSIKVA